MSVAFSRISGLPAGRGRPSSRCLQKVFDHVLQQIDPRLVFELQRNPRGRIERALFEPANPVVILNAVHETAGVGRPVEAEIGGVNTAARDRGDDRDIGCQRPRFLACGVAQIIEPFDDRSAERGGARAAAGDRQQHERSVRTSVERSLRRVRLAGGERIVVSAAVPHPLSSTAL